MGKIIDKIQVATGRDSSNNFDLSCFHATTTNFYSPRVTYYHEFVPDEKWKMDARCSVRCLPMVRPTIADIKIHNRFFFVPYFSIMNDWNDFIAESPTSNSGTVLTIPTVPTTTEYDIVQMFTNTTGNIYATPTTVGEIDFDANNTAGQKIGWKFTPEGRNVYSILNGLGITINWSVSESAKGNTINMLGILSYLKIYLDWYNNSAFDTKKYLEQYFNLPLGQRTFDKTKLHSIFSAVSRIYLEKDYFTSATLYPIGTNSRTMQSDHSILDITSNSLLNVASVNSSSNLHGTPFVQQDQPNNNITLTKYSLDAVQSLTDYVKRHQLAGIQPFNRILAEYGVTLDDEALRRSTFIGDVLEDVDIKSVINNSYADDSDLGERAGLADGGQSKNLDFHNKNFGCIICVSTVVPRTSYTEGIKRAALRTDRFDWFTPSVEHLGTEPLYVSELYNNFTGNETGSLPAPEQIFGYLPRYASYKTALDSMSGGFMQRSKRDMLLPWILRREFPNIKTSRQSIVSINEDFTVANGDKVSDIFVDESQDNFIIFNMYHVNSRLPMHKLYDDYQWSNEGDDPQHVTISNQGVQLT